MSLFWVLPLLTYHFAVNHFAEFFSAAVGKSKIENPKSKILIGTRGSALALAQTTMVAEALVAAWPGLTYELVRITTTGDRKTKENLAEIGGKGLFTKELEDALLGGEVDLAVHSLKDLPTELAPGLAIGAIPPRAPANDALIIANCRLPIADCQAGIRSPESAVSALPSGAAVATSSPRRGAQLLLARPDLRIVPIRGNLDTRLRKLREGQADALVLALAGLIRLGIVAVDSRPEGESRAEPSGSATAGLSSRALDPHGRTSRPWHTGQSGSAGASPSHSLLDGFTVHVIPFELMLPAPGQGALAIEIRGDNAPIAGLVARISDGPTVAATTAERALLEALGGGCQLPLGAHAEVLGDTLRLRAILLSPDGKQAARADHTGPAADPAAVARLAAEDLGAQGLHA